MALDVAVVVPRPGPIFAPADLEALRRPDGLHVDGSAVLEPAVTVDVEGVMVVTEGEHVPLDEITDARVEDRCVADERPAVNRHEAGHRLEKDHELPVRHPLVPAEDRERSIHPALDRVHHRRGVVVVWPDAGGIDARYEPASERSAGLDIA